MATTVRIDALEKRFGSLRAVDGVSLDLEPGITGFLGPNGAGKTTLLRMIATVLSPDRGHLEIFGHPPRRRVIGKRSAGASATSRRSRASTAASPRSSSWTTSPS